MYVFFLLGPSICQSTTMGLTSCFSAHFLFPAGNIISVTFSLYGQLRMGIESLDGLESWVIDKLDLCKHKGGGKI